MPIMMKTLSVAAGQLPGPRLQAHDENNGDCHDPGGTQSARTDTGGLYHSKQHQNTTGLLSEAHSPESSESKITAN